MTSSGTAPLVMTTGLGTGPQSRQEMIAACARVFRRDIPPARDRESSRDRKARRSRRWPTTSSLMDHPKVRACPSDRAVDRNRKGHGVAARHPGRVEKLVLAAPWTHGDDLLDLIQHVRMAADGMPAELYASSMRYCCIPPRYRREHTSRFATAADATGVKRMRQVCGARLEAILRFDARPCIRSSRARRW